MGNEINVSFINAYHNDEYDSFKVKDGEKHTSARGSLQSSWYHLWARCGELKVKVMKVEK